MTVGLGVAIVLAALAAGLAITAAIVVAVAALCCLLWLVTVAPVLVWRALRRT